MTNIFLVRIVGTENYLECLDRVLDDPMLRSVVNSAEISRYKNIKNGGSGPVRFLVELHMNEEQSIIFKLKFDSIIEDTVRELSKEYTNWYFIS